LIKLIDLDNCNKVVQLLHESRSCAGQITKVYKNCVLVRVDFYEHFIFPENKVVEIIILQGRELLLSKSLVLGTRKSNDYIYLVLSPPEILRTIDRRMYHRTPINLKVSYAVFGKNIYYNAIHEVPTHVLANNQYKNGIITDISGGGVMIQCKENLDIGDQVIVSMNIKFGISLLSRITRKEVISDSDSTVYLYGIYFDIITEREREKIIEFVFENEIYLRHKSKNKEKVISQ
jgi:c-di-GMP-binding flagellar brake protein YcgR